MSIACSRSQSARTRTKTGLSVLSNFFIKDYTLTTNTAGNLAK
jgi:hypothetical protein